MDVLSLPTQRLFCGMITLLSCQHKTIMRYELYFSSLPTQIQSSTTKNERLGFCRLPYFLSRYFLMNPPSACHDPNFKPLSVTISSEPQARITCTTYTGRTTIPPEHPRLTHTRPVHALSSINVTRSRSASPRHKLPKRGRKERERKQRGWHPIPAPRG